MFAVDICSSVVMGIQCVRHVTHVHTHLRINCGKYVVRFVNCTLFTVYLSFKLNVFHPFVERMNRVYDACNIYICIFMCCIIYDVYNI